MEVRKMTHELNNLTVGTILTMYECGLYDGNAEWVYTYVEDGVIKYKY